MFNQSYENGTKLKYVETDQEARAKENESSILMLPSFSEEHGKAATWNQWLTIGDFHVETLLVDDMGTDWRLTELTVTYRKASVNGSLMLFRSRVPSFNMVSPNSMVAQFVWSTNSSAVGSTRIDPLPYLDRGCGWNAIRVDLRNDELHGLCRGVRMKYMEHNNDILE
jgi:hypothetical protein